VYGDGISSTLWQSRCEIQWQSKGDWFLELFWDEETKPRWFAEVVSLKLTVEQDAADEAVALVGRLPSLQELSIDIYGGNRRLADESLQAIAGLRRLRALALRRIGHNWDMSVIGLCDAQVARLASLTELRTLDLTNNHITDEGLRHLRGLKRLEVLEISNNPITDDGVSELTQSIPGLMVLDD
ncbi:MAG: leucine-rich repeat domain-containing protein, partial [Gemmataceae bacterium]|nr:leucine-rich repeat domain-containing protein [Gemmataceae bacterium]